MEFKNRNLPEPYRILFPLGVFASLIGIGLWLLVSEGLISFFPRQAHANIMYFCFLWSFIAGFLMTAIPKMTGTSKANIYEMGFAVLLVLTQLVFSLGNNFPFAVIIFALQTLLLIEFIVRRFLLKKQIPFEGFLFIPFAFLQVFIAITLFFRTMGISSDTFYLLAGEAFVLNLIVGLGSRLIPVLSRVPNTFTPDVQLPGSNWRITIFLAVTLNFGFWMQALGLFYLGLGVRFFVLAWVAVKNFKIFSRVTVKSFVGLGLRIGVFFMLLSYVLGLFFPAHFMSMQHLLYIGGFVLITFMVGTRVMLAHGGESLSYETDSKRLGVVALFFAFASWLRVFAGTEIFGNVLKLAIALFALAVCFWMHKFIHILLQKKSGHECG